MAKSIKLVTSAAVLVVSGAVAAFLLLSESPSLKPQTNFLSFESEVDRAFANFIARHARSYGNKEEHAKRFDIFRSTFDMVQRHNARKDVTSVLEINKFADMADEEFSSYRSSEEDLETLEKFDIKRLDITNSTIAYSVDWSRTSANAPVHD